MRWTCLSTADGGLASGDDDDPCGGGGTGTEAGLGAWSASKRSLFSTDA